MSKDVKSRDANLREVDTRESETRSWRRPGHLPEPDKQPGYEYRWVRQSTLGVLDPTNWSNSRYEGWEPVPLSEQPNLNILINRDGKNKDLIEIGGLVLCKMPKEMHDERTNFYSDMRDKQTEAIGHEYMKENDPRMQKFNDSKTKISFGHGRI